MPDQDGGGNATESLSQETSQQNTPKPILNHAASNKMGGWKNDILGWMAKRSPGMSQGQPINPSQTSKTLAGAADPNVPGGPKEIQALAQNAQAQPQPIANPAGAADNSGKMASYHSTKESSMSQVNPRRVEIVRAMLKFASCMKKGKKKKGWWDGRSGLGKKADEDVPGVSVAAPMTAAGIGAGTMAATQGLSRNLPKITNKLDRINPELADQLLNLLSQRSARNESLLPPAGGSRLGAYLGQPALGAATLAGPVWAGAAAAKHKGGAGRGAAVGTGTGAGIGLVAQLAAAIAARKTQGIGAALKQNLPRALGAGAAVGAVGGAIGGGVQKRRRTKAQEKAKPTSKKKESKEAGFRGPDHTLADEWDDLKGVLSGQHGNAFQSIKAVKEKAKARKASREKNEKEAQLKRVLHKRATGAAAPAATWGLKKILGLGVLGAGTLGAAAVAGPPIARGLQHKLEYNWGDPMYKMDHDTQMAMKKMMAGPLGQMMMMRNMGMGGMGGMGGMPPIMNPEDRQMLQHATYLRGLRSRVKAMQEAYEV
jgi:hypothetical protein